MLHKTTILVLLLAAAPALAAPAEIAAVIHAKTPIGQGDAGALFLTAYKASLWTDAPAWAMEKPFALTIQYDMGFDTDDLVSRTVKEMRHVDPALGDDKIATLTTELNKVFPPVQKGDRFTALYLPGKPVSFYRNGKRTGRIGEPGFAKDFFGIWLSSQTSDPSLRQSLLKSP